MIGIFRIFFNAKGTRPWLVLSCLLIAGVFEMVGLGAMLPVFSLAADRGEATNSLMEVAVLDTLNAVGLHPTLLNLVLIVVGMLLLKSLMSFLAMSYAGYAVAEVSTRLRQRLLVALFDARWSYLVGRKSGHIANAISNDATRAGDAYMEAARFVAYGVEGLVYLIAAILVSPRLAIIGLVMGGVLSAALGQLIRLSRKAGRKQVSATSELVTHVSDALNNIKPIKAMDRKAHFTVLFAARIGQLKRALRNKVVYRQALLKGQEALVALLFGAGIYASTAVWKVPLSELIVTGIIVAFASQSWKKLQGTLQQANELEGSYYAGERLIRELEGEAENMGGTRQPTLERGCRFEHVTFSHETATVVDNVSFEIPAGSVTVLQGPSGAGKTTIVDLLLGLYRPDGGRITVDGAPLEELSLAAWRRMIGYVPQELGLLHGSIRLNIALGNEALSDEDIEEALRAAGAEPFIARLPEGLDTVVGEMGARLSGGERQRIALARALVGKPRLLILDEVTSALDPATEASICANVAALAGPYTVIAITHRPAWASVASRLFTVEHGRVRLIENAHQAAAAE